MKKYVMWLAAGALAVGLSGCGQPEAQEEKESAAEATQEISSGEEGADDTLEEPDYYGTWKVTDYIVSAVSAMPQEEAGALVGSTVTYRARSVSDGQEEIAIEGYEEALDAYTKTDFGEDYRADLGSWWDGVESLSYVAALSDEVFFGSQFFVTDSGELWIMQDGAFFRAEKDS
ncbi:MAG: hypothetical protein Q4C82_04780 [Eubacteriales bacterium]|nr:hypothetical protein [Eubacteriales bacterium]